MKIVTTSPGLLFHWTEWFLVGNFEWGAIMICTKAHFIFGIINDLEERVTCKILKRADDTKLFRKTKDIGDKKMTR